MISINSEMTVNCIIYIHYIFVEWWIVYIFFNLTTIAGTKPKIIFISDKNMTRVDNSHLASKKITYYHCTRCCKEATPSCLRHKQQIELFYGSEIEKLAVWKQYQCNYCTKIGYSSDSRIICWFCSSTSIKLL